MELGAYSSSNHHRRHPVTFRVADPRAEDVHRSDYEFEHYADLVRIAEVWDEISELFDALNSPVVSLRDPPSTIRAAIRRSSNLLMGERDDITRVFSSKFTMTFHPIFKIASTKAPKDFLPLAGSSGAGVYPTLTTTTMPVTFSIAKHKTEDVERASYELENPADPAKVVSSVWQEDGVSCEEVIQSSYRTNQNFITSSSGFVSGVLRSYNSHHNLVIRPDDLWTAILSQLNFYVNAHAEELRSTFVAHEGKKQLIVTATGSRYSVDFGRLAEQMGGLLRKNIKDPSLHDWIIPQFSTTTSNDIVVCCVMMMSTLKAYFSYGIELSCGVPSITLLGEKSDYESILQRLERLETFGKETTIFARLLRPVLKEFCATFDGPPNLDFWERICHYQRGGSGPSYLGGWITAFCVWSDKGKWQGGDLEEIEKPVAPRERASSFTPPPALFYEGLRYPVIKTGDIPNGYCEVDVNLNDNGEEFDCKMLAGHVGYLLPQPDTIQPSSEWFMFIKGKAETEAEKMERIMNRFRALKQARE